MGAPTELARDSGRSGDPDHLPGGLVEGRPLEVTVQVHNLESARLQQMVYLPPEGVPQLEVTIELADHGAVVVQLLDGDPCVDDLVVEIVA